ncbi:hypothetical protein FB459_2669 [Yimella lutea]|uniref:Uncharacterized protein n=1 Tax=Yimella lutea TaxID=587872 RepID=A0A542EIH8_9MICO|nr:hypothetical protein FB459_2669 [Yimella lutea]
MRRTDGTVRTTVCTWPTRKECDRKDLLKWVKQQMPAQRRVLREAKEAERRRRDDEAYELGTLGRQRPQDVPDHIGLTGSGLAVNQQVWVRAEVDRDRFSVSSDMLNATWPGPDAAWSKLQVFIPGLPWKNACPDGATDATNETRSPIERASHRMSMRRPRRHFRWSRCDSTQEVTDETEPAYFSGSIRARSTTVRWSMSPASRRAETNRRSFSR